MSDTQIETLLREIRDLQAETLQAIQQNARVTQARADMVWGNVGRSRILSFVFVGIAGLFILWVWLHFAR